MAAKNELMELDKIMRAVKLRREGKSIPTIAAELGMKTGTISRMVAEGLRALQSDLQGENELLRADIHARLEWAMERLAPEVELGKPFAVEKWISLNMSIAKLYGLLETGNNAPALSQTNITINNNDSKPAIPDAGAAKAARLLNMAAERLERLMPPASKDIVEGHVIELSE